MEVSRIEMKHGCMHVIVCMFEFVEARRFALGKRTCRRFEEEPMEEPLVPWVGVLDINLCWAFTARAITIIVAIVTNTPAYDRTFYLLPVRT